MSFIKEQSTLLLTRLINYETVKSNRSSCTQKDIYEINLNCETVKDPLAINKNVAHYFLNEYRQILSKNVLVEIN